MNALSPGTRLPRLPGLFFEAPPPAVETPLPRMDIAAFVGFAAAGPLHVPVAVEDAGRFRDVFGESPELAWDDERGAVRRAHLGPAVEAFFANGGRRAWVVRAAEDGDAVDGGAVRHRFTLPGLIGASEAALGSPCVLAEAEARARGPWCEDLAVGTALFREPLRVRRLETEAETETEIAFDVAADPGRFLPGDLLEVSFADGPPETGATLGFVFVDSVEGTEDGVRLRGTAAEASAGISFVTSPPELPVVRRLTFELLVWRDTELVARLGELAFDRRHPRFWGHLPTDEALFRDLLEGRPPEGLAAEVAEPRFPLAGPPEPAPENVVENAAEARYLPCEMRSDRRAQDAVPLAGPFDGTRLDRGGLRHFGASLFLDRRLADLRQGALLAEAEHLHHLRGQRFRGLHALLPITEISLVAVPDAVHRGWDHLAPSAAPPLGAPELEPIPSPDAAGRHLVHWTEVEEATAYELEYADDPAFTLASRLFQGDEDEAATEAVIVLPADCPRPRWLRVRALRHGEVGPWSNSRGARLPVADFVPCEARIPGPLHLVLEPGSPPGDDLLLWFPEADASPPEDAAHDLRTAPAERYEVEEATDAAFLGGALRGPGPGAATELALERRRDGVRYYRVRGLVGGRPGPWSNTVAIAAERRAVFAEPPARSYDDGHLMAIHRAVLRFAAAGARFLALLALPEHYRQEEVLVHVGRLTPGGGDDAPLLPGLGSFPAVPPLTLGEAPVLSFGALYHPWLTARSAPSSRAAAEDRAAAAGPLVQVPPEGAMVGLLARLALERGVWRAPANLPLAGVLALGTTIDRDAWTRLAASRVNALLREPQGFLTLGADTLAAVGDVRVIHVRRLLMLLRRLALREGERFVFEPHSAGLRDRLRHRFEHLLLDLYRRGAFAGQSAEEAFRVRADEVVNPPASVDAGRLVVELQVAPAPELARLTVRLVAGADQLTVDEP